jgi:hypothetical protein
VNVEPAPAWAVGGTGKGTEMGLGNYTGTFQPLVLHWNGKRWSPSAGVPKVNGWLNAVAVSGSNVWAVGETFGKSGRGTGLILHETGGHWYIVPNEAPASSALWTIAATGPHSAWAGGAGGANYTAWAVGYDANGSGGNGALSMEWNGKAWRAYAVPLADGFLNAAAPVPGTAAAWAVGYAYLAPPPGVDYLPWQTVILHWNGTSWG